MSKKQIRRKLYDDFHGLKRRIRLILSEKSSQLGLDKTVAQFPSTENKIIILLKHEKLSMRKAGVYRAQQFYEMKEQLRQALKNHKTLVWKE